MLLRNHHRREQPRRGAVLLMVLIVVVLLSLAAYQYSDLMVAEYKASDNYHKAAQARAFADSGVHYAAALLSSPDAVSGMLNGNPFDNEDAFRHIAAGGDNDKGPRGYFTLIAPLDPNSDAAGPVRYGVSDEGGKININGLMKRDGTGQLLYDMLIKLALPNMTPEVAGAIVDWVDADSTPFQGGGAENEYYSSLTPSYRVKNGPLDSIGELLLVKGVTPELLYGNDRNRNGIKDLDEEGDEGSFDRGLSAFLTIYSREANVDATGLPLTYVNGNELDAMFETLAPHLGDDLAKFILLYRQYGPSNTSGKQQSIGGTILSLLTGGKGGGKSSQSKTVPGKLADFSPDFTRKARQKVRSLFDLIGTQVTVAAKDPKQPSILYTSPLNDTAMARDLLPKLFQNATVFEQSELPARINVNTAPYEVLAALPELTETDARKLLELRRSAGEGGNPLYDTPAWLVLEAGLSPTTLSKLEKTITTRSQVYSVQVLGYFESQKGPVARVEAVIDVNAGRPRILAYRDLTDLGRSRIP